MPSGASSDQPGRSESSQDQAQPPRGQPRRVPPQVLREQHPAGGGAVRQVQDGISGSGQQARGLGDGGEDAGRREEDYPAGNATVGIFPLQS